MKWRTHLVLLGVRVLWTGLAALRVIQPSFIHPDEHFQCGEVAFAFLGLGDFSRVELDDDNIALGRATGLMRPWEFEQGRLARSAVSAQLACGIPLGMVKAAWPSYEVTGDQAYFWIRVWMGLLALVGDFATMYVASGSAAILRVLMWPSLALTQTTFSNSIESLVLDLLAVCAIADSASKVSRARFAFLGGFLVGLGCFVRITFPAFAVPFILYALLHRWHRSDGYRGVFDFVFSAATGAILAASICIAFDTQVNQGSLVVAPLKNLLYNVDATNLAKHGTHSRLTHAFVNLPLLFGPTLVVCLCSFGMLLVRKPMRSLGERNVLWLGALTLPILALSGFPHQEPRFLLPLVLPMSVIGVEILFSTSPTKRRVALLVHFVFHFILTLFYGSMHQGGLVDAAIELGRIGATAKGSETVCITSVGTYDVPRYLLGQELLGKAHVLDLRSHHAPMFRLYEEDCSVSYVIGPRNYLTSKYVMGEEIWNSTGVHFNGELESKFDTLVIRKRKGFDL